METISRRRALAGSMALGLSGSASWAKPVPAAGSAPDSLNAIAASRGLAFGSCLGTAAKKEPAVPGTADHKPVPASFDDPKMRALFAAQCGILVPENELKWYALRPTPKGFDFRRADLLMRFAERQGLAVRGHTLLWNRGRWMLDWVRNIDFGAKPALAAEKMLRHHIDTVCRRYGKRIFSYDVVNETIAPDTGEMEDSPFTKALGPEVIDLCFHAAREAAPHAQLVYNDYMSWSVNGGVHRAAVLRLLERLKKADVPIDALGIQAHIGSNGNGTATGPLSDVDLTGWRKFLDEVSAMGIDLVVTELDVNDRHVAGSIVERDRVVADLTKAYMEVVLSYPRLRNVIAWGLSDKYSWLQATSPRPDGLPKRSLPYDEDYRPKPMRDALAECFAAAPMRPALAMRRA